jgi:phage terminase Nu1 subunit (DNA packaging protein)
MAVRLLTVSAYARHRGCDEKAVRKAIAENRISAQTGPKGRKLIDPEVADIQWARNTRARVGAGDAAGRVDETGDLLSAAVVETFAPGGKVPAPTATGYTEARARTEMANAAMAELQLAKLKGEVRDVSDITRGGFDIARELRDAMDASVPTLATELAGVDTADACAQVLRRHNRTIQEMLAKGLREKLSLKVIEL